MGGLRTPSSTLERLLSRVARRRRGAERQRAPARPRDARVGRLLPMSELRADRMTRLRSTLSFRSRTP